MNFTGKTDRQGKSTSDSFDNCSVSQERSDCKVGVSTNLAGQLFIGIKATYCRTLSQRNLVDVPEVAVIFLDIDASAFYRFCFPFLGPDWDVPFDFCFFLGMKMTSVH